MDDVQKFIPKLEVFKVAKEYTKFTKMLYQHFFLAKSENYCQQIIRCWSFSYLPRVSHILCCANVSILKVNEWSSVEVSYTVKIRV